MKRGRRRYPNRETALFAARGATRCLARAIEKVKDGAGVFQERAASRGKLHAAWPAMEQPNVEFALQRFDLLAKRRLLHAETLSGPVM
jgi:hypothetical protein